jgi:hypothetical protein
LPKERKSWTSCAHAPELEAPGVYHRSLTSIIRSTFEDDVSKTFHMTPYSQYWKVSDTKTVQVFSEAYSSPAMLDAYTEVDDLPREPDVNLECVVATLMMWLDATHLTNFGDASLWPFYLYFGNQSKYPRGKPALKACHHVAYIPTVCSILILIGINVYFMWAKTIAPKKRKGGNDLPLPILPVSTLSSPLLSLVSSALQSP